MPSFNIEEILVKENIETIISSFGEKFLKKFRGPFNKNILHYATRNPNSNVLQHFLSENFLENVDEPSENGSTPLQMAAYYGNLEAIRILIEYGADAKKKNMVGQDLLQILKARGYENLIPEAQEILNARSVKIGSDDKSDLTLRQRRHGPMLFDNSSSNLNYQKIDNAKETDSLVAKHK